MDLTRIELLGIRTEPRVQWPMGDRSHGRGQARSVGHHERRRKHESVGAAMAGTARHGWLSPILRRPSLTIRRKHTRSPSFAKRELRKTPLFITVLPLRGMKSPQFEDVTCWITR